jgi:hypothetical protein
VLATAEGVVVELLMPAAPCAPCQDALEELDRAAALVAPELRARGERLRVRVIQLGNGAPREGNGPMPTFEVRVNGVPVPQHGTAPCADAGATACADYEWEGSTYSVPPAELLTTAIHDAVDRRA